MKCARDDRRRVKISQQKESTCVGPCLVGSVRWQNRWSFHQTKAISFSMVERTSTSGQNDKTRILCRGLHVPNCTTTVAALRQAKQVQLATQNAHVRPRSRPPDKTIGKNIFYSDLCVVATKKKKKKIKNISLIATRTRSGNPGRFSPQKAFCVRVCVFRVRRLKYKSEDSKFYLDTSIWIRSSSVYVHVAFGNSDATWKVWRWI